MKKNLIYIILLLLIAINITKVEAKNEEFYEAEYIPNIYLKRINKTTIYYQKAQIFREKGTNKPVYCIQPFVSFNKNSNYIENNNLTYLNDEQKRKISLLSYYGYTYKNHSDIKWYAITQYMIWKVAEPNYKFYFTDKLNGNKIEIFQNEIQELSNLVNKHNILPKFANQTIKLVHNNPTAIYDENEKIEKYKINEKNDQIKILNNCIYIQNLDIGDHKIEFKENNNYYEKNLSFYTSENSQDIITIGNIEINKFYINIKIEETKIIINKIDYDTKKFKEQGEGKLIGTKLGIYNTFNDLLKIVEIKNENEIIKDLNYGYYYIKEISPGIGYKINNKKYEFEIEENKNEINIKIENNIIRKKIIIKKLYGQENNFLPEKNISFNVYDKNETLIKTYKTNNEGLIEFNLPYGTYKIKQMTTTDGYNKVKEFKININDEIEKEIILKNYKIEVPDTYINKKNKNFLLSFIKLIWKKLKLY